MGSEEIFGLILLHVEGPWSEKLATLLFLSIAPVAELSG